MTMEDYIKHWRERAVSAEVKAEKLSRELMFWKAGCITFGVVVIILTWIS